MSNEQQLREAAENAVTALERVTTSETFYKDPRGDIAGPAIDELMAALSQPMPEAAAQGRIHLNDVVAWKHKKYGHVQYRNPAMTDAVWASYFNGQWYALDDLGEAIPSDKLTAASPAAPAAQPPHPQPQAQGGPEERASGVDVHNLLREAAAQQEARAAQLPTEQDCIRMMIQCRLRLLDLGWRSGEYAPKDGSTFTGINPGFAGPARYQSLGRGYFIEDGGDLWPAPRPLVFKETT